MLPERPIEGQSAGTPGRPGCAYQDQLIGEREAGDGAVHVVRIVEYERAWRIGSGGELGDAVGREPDV